MRTTDAVCAAMVACLGCGDSGGPTGSPPAGSPTAGMARVAASQQPFTMGHDTDAPPAHTVTLTYDYWTDTTEVTQGEYRRLLGQEPWASTDTAYRRADNCPAYNVNWYDAALYCNARSKALSLDTVYSYTALAGTPGLGVTPDPECLAADTEPYLRPGRNA